MELSNINNSIIYKSKMESLAKYIGDYKNAKMELSNMGKNDTKYYKSKMENLAYTIGGYDV